MEILQPKLRFPEFTGKWETKKLSDVSKIGRGKSKHRPRDAEFLYGGIYPFIQTGDIRNSGLYLSNYNQTYSEAGLKQSKLWDENTLCITIAANIAETTILKIKACFPDSIIGLIPLENETIVLFVKYQFDKFKLEIQNLSQGVAQANLNQEKLSKIEFNFPLVEEQTKIANFLSSIDEKINLLKEKKSLLEDYKNGIMQKIFNQEIRFKNDNGNNFEDWEEKSFKSILKSIATKKHQIQSSEIFEEGKYPVIDQGKKMVAGFSDNLNNLFNDYPIIVFGDHTTILKYIDFDFIVGADGTKLLKNINNDNLKYLYYNLIYNNVEQEGYKRHFSILSEISLQIPSTNEQMKIANFLSAIDEKIELVSNQIQDTQEYKKGLLQQMFV
jgi:type I restriction enzyme S subunit